MVDRHQAKCGSRSQLWAVIACFFLLCDTLNGFDGTLEVYNIVGDTYNTVEFRLDRVLHMYIEHIAVMHAARERI